jgi:hypothetical protein
MIADEETLRNAWHIFKYMAAELSSPANCSGTEQVPVLEVQSILPSDKRLKELKTWIVRGEEGKAAQEYEINCPANCPALKEGYA